jgi:putative transposase
MTTIQISHKIEIASPSNKFKTYCRKAFGISRLAYNWALGRIQEQRAQAIADAYKITAIVAPINKAPLLIARPATRTKKKITYPKIDVMALKKEFNAIKKKEYPYCMEVTKYAAQQPFLNLKKALKAYFESYKKGSTRKVGFPKFKKKSATSGSFYIGGDFVKLTTTKPNCNHDKTEQISSNTQYLKIPKFGWVKLTEKIRFNGHINSCVISQHGDRFYASFNLEISEDEYKRTHKGNEVNTEHTIVGIDVGLKAFITTDAGLFIQAPKPLKRLEQRLKRAQRVLSRRVHPKAKGDTTKCSNRFKKQRLYVSKLQRRIANIRKDYTHKVSSLLIRHYQYLSLESLRVQNMMKNHKLAKAIADVGFSAFKTQLLYKAQYNHRVVFEADTFFPSSKLCSNCGAIHKHLTLADRTYVCPSCGFTIDRDINAAINLKEKMKQTLIGGVTAEFMRVDPHRLNEDLAINQVKAMAYEARI